MNEKLSALMDGELDRDEAVGTIKSLGANDAHRKDWDCYHLIGDALRGDHQVDSTSDGAKIAARRRASAESIFARLADEPTVLAPVAIRSINETRKFGDEQGAQEPSREHAKKSSRAPVQQRTRFALAMAASVVTVSAIGVVAFKQQQSAPSGVVATNQANPVSIVQAASPASSAVSAVSPDARVNDYLMVHRQFANPSAFQAAAMKRTERVLPPLPPTLEKTEQRRAVGQ